MSADSEMVSVCIQVFESMKYNTPLVMDFIQFGGLDLLEKAMRMHSQDDFISMTIPKLLNILLGERNVYPFLVIFEIVSKLSFCPQPLVQLCRFRN